MTEVNSTRLRFVASANADDLVNFISRLPFKVEIKGGPAVKDNRWFLFFVIPANVNLNSVTIS